MLPNRLTNTLAQRFLFNTGENNALWLQGNRQTNRLTNSRSEWASQLGKFCLGKLFAQNARKDSLEFNFGAVPVYFNRKMTKRFDSLIKTQFGVTPPPPPRISLRPLPPITHTSM